VRILQVCPKYYPSLGGVEQHVRNISERLAHEHEVTVFACDPSGQLPEEETINGVSIKRFRSFSPQDAYHVSFGMLSELRHSSFDVVHGHSYHAIPLLFSSYAGRNRFVVTAHYHGHGSTRLRDTLMSLYKPLGRRALREADVITAVSNYEKALLVRDFHIEDKIAVIPSGINLDEFRGLSAVEKTNKTILSVGRLEKYKGVQYIIQTLPLLDKDIHLDIVGNGPYKEQLVGLTKELELDSRVEFYQNLPKGDLLSKYANADVCVLLSKYEAFGTVIAESLAAGTPCIVANTSALVEWVDNMNCSGIDYPISIDKLARLVNEVIGKRVNDVKLWDWDDVVRETLRVYKE
jgi:glycosyltransferase involved in cell wall biosynthesis